MKHPICIILPGQPLLQKIEKREEKQQQEEKIPKSAYKQQSLVLQHIGLRLDFSPF